MDSLSLIKSPITTELNEFKELYDSSLNSSNTLLNSVVSHIRNRNGKMMRPMLVLLVARLFGGVSRRTLHAAVSLELLHTASLIHDDVVDESRERRGQLSVNAIFNNKVAILSGDYLLATSLVHAELTGSHNIISVVSTLGQELSEGELLQLSNVSNKEFSEAIYFEVIRKKTAALFSACTKVGAYSVADNDEKAEKARLFGECVGVCFQIRDDIFDYYDNKEIGKPTGNDMLEGKLTLPVIYALNLTNDEKAINIAWKIKDGKASADEIAFLVAFTKEKGGITYAEQVMHSYKQKALDLLTTFPDSEVRAALEAYMNYVVYRNK